MLVILFNYCSFGPIQFRIAEALTILPYFTPAAIPGLFVGCLLSNILGGAAIWDIIFGSIATLIGAIGTYVLRKNKWLAPLPPIIANTVIVPFVLKYAYGSEGIFAMFFVTIGASEFIVCGIIGMLLLFALNPVRNYKRQKRTIILNNKYGSPSFSSLARERYALSHTCLKVKHSIFSKKVIYSIIFFNNRYYASYTDAMSCFVRYGCVINKYRFNSICVCNVDT